MTADGEPVDTVVVGAGQAGLAVSHLLAAADVDHVVLERGRVGESWRSQRWDSFTLNTPNWANQLPGWVLGDQDPDAFATRDELVAGLDAYASAVPVRQQTTVTRVEQADDGRFAVATTNDDLRARNVVVCSGGLSRPRLPRVAQDAPAHLETFTAATYRNAGDLPDGGVLVVGSGQSGCQITEDLLAAGRTVHLATSRVGRLPRRYRGRDVLAWLVDAGFFDQAVEDLEDPATVHAAQPQVSGTDGGHTVSLQSLARDGAHLLGRLVGIDGSTAQLAPTLRACAEFADQRAAETRAAIDRYIAANGIDAPAAEPDPQEPPMPDLEDAEAVTLDLDRAGVSSIVWCTGFEGDLGWIDPGLRDTEGRARHRRGVADTPGLYYVGLPWLSRRSSGLLLGVGADAEHVAGRIIGSTS